MAQLMPLPLTVSCFSKIQIGFTFWYRLTWIGVCLDETMTEQILVQDMYVPLAFSAVTLLAGCQEEHPDRKN